MTSSIAPHTTSGSGTRGLHSLAGTLSLLVKRHTSNEYYRDKVIAEHQELFDAIRSRDAEACEKAIREHLSATYDRLVASFKDSGEI